MSAAGSAAAESVQDRIHHRLAIPLQRLQTKDNALISQTSVEKSFHDKEPLDVSTTAKKPALRAATIGERLMGRKIDANLCSPDLDCAIICCYHLQQ